MISEKVLLSRQHHAATPLKHRGLYLDSYKPYNELSEQALTAAHAFVDSFPQRVSLDLAEGDRELLGRGFALVGPHSSGKTTLSCLVLNEVLRLGYDVYFVAFADYIGWLLRQMSVKAQADKLEPRALEVFWSIEDRKERVYTSDFVVLDDVGKEHRTNSKFAEDELDRLLRFKHRNALPVGATTNLPLNEWGKVYDKSMAGFVLEAFEEIGLGGKNLRRENRGY